MGKKKNKRHRNESKRRESTPISRRVFLMGGLIAAVGGLSSVKLKPKRKWEFLKDHPEGPLDAPTYVRGKYVPIGPETVLHPHRPHVREFLDHIAEQVDNAIYPSRTKKTLTCLQQRYGVPLDSAIAEAYEHYCKQANSFLYDTVRHLTPHNIEFVQVTSGQEFNKEYNHKAFIVDYFYELWTGIADTQRKRFSMEALYRQRGGRMLSKPSTPQDYYLILGRGSGAIHATFSEIIPISLMETLPNDIAELGDEETVHIAQEACSEAMAYLLTERLVTEIGVPKGKTNLDNSFEVMSQFPEYKMVPGAIAWMRKHGVQEGFDLYKASRKEFLRRIST